MRPVLPVSPDATHQRVELHGLAFDRLDEAGAVRIIIDGCRSDGGGWACPVNTDVLRQHHRSSAVRALIAEADLVLADGMPIVWASKLAGSPLPQRVAGSSMVHALADAAARTDVRMFLLGGAADTARIAAQRLERDHVGATVVGTHSPPFGFEADPGAGRAIEESLLAVRPDLVFVGLGFPKQEELIRRLRPLLPTTWFVSSGATFSFLSGDVRRAPEWAQRLGLEWLHRLVQEPRRLFRRYLIEGVPFVLGFLATAVVSRFTR